jgi:hypothetical protein
MILGGKGKWTSITSMLLDTYRDPLKFIATVTAVSHPYESSLRPQGEASPGELRLVVPLNV